MAAEEKEKVRGLKVFLLVNGKWFEVVLTENIKYRIYKIVDEKKIILKPKA